MVWCTYLVYICGITPNLWLSPSLHLCYLFSNSFNSNWPWRTLENPQPAVPDPWDQAHENAVLWKMNHLHFSSKVGEAHYFFQYRQQMFCLSTLLTTWKKNLGLWHSTLATVFATYFRLDVVPIHSHISVSPENNSSFVVWGVTGVISVSMSSSIEDDDHD